jgi:hypothetical protein
MPQASPFIANKLLASKPSASQLLTRSFARRSGKTRYCTRKSIAA